MDGIKELVRESNKIGGADPCGISGTIADAAHIAARLAEESSSA